LTNFKIYAILYIEILRKDDFQMAKNELKKLRDERRNAEVQKIFDFLTEQGEDIGYYKSNKLAYPIVLSDGTEDWVTITVTIPVGANKRTEAFDGYGERESYEIALKEKAEKEEERKKKNAEKAARDKARRESEKAIKEKRSKGE
jgi:hypothetical protein